MPDWASPWWSPVANVIVIVALALFDRLFSSSRCRWFSVHAFANFLVCLSALRATLATLADPLHAMDSSAHDDSGFFGSGSPWPLIIINSVHLYHMLAFKLTNADYFHHLLFIPTMGAFGQLYRLGAFRGFLAFWISGLPGGLDYLNLCLVKHGRLNLHTQKRYCAAINVWLRGPSLIVSGFIIYLTYCYLPTSEESGSDGAASMSSAAAASLPPLPVALMVGGLTMFNGQYYTKQSVANFAITHCLGHVQERVSVSTGMAVPDWKNVMSSPRMKAPQNTMS